MGAAPQICLNKKDSTMNSWILALLVSLLYMYASGNVGDGECAKKNADSTKQPVTCDSDKSDSSLNNMCSAKKPKDGDNAITFDKMSTTAFNGLGSTVSQGQQMIVGTEIVCYFPCTQGTDVAEMANGDKEFKVSVCAALPSDSTSDSASDSASDTASGKSSDLASMIHAISIAIPLANI